jgi:hypothetical protein
LFISFSLSSQDPIRTDGISLDENQNAEFQVIPVESFPFVSRANKDEVEQIALQENCRTSREFDEQLPDHCAKENRSINSEAVEEGTDTPIENILENTPEKTAETILENENPAEEDEEVVEDADENEAVPQKRTTISPVNVVDYNLFLSYAWGEDHETHAKVKILADFLIEQGERPFFDYHNLRGNMKDEVSEVLARLPIFVTILNKEYNEKVKGKSTLDYCFFELNYATSVCQQKILVILDESMKNIKTWCARIQAEFANMLYFDLSGVDWKDKDTFNHSFTPLMEEILRLKKKM